jgi:hypothetical protein
MAALLLSCGKKADRGVIRVIEVDGVPTVQNPAHPLRDSCPWNFAEELAVSNENAAPETSFTDIRDLVADDDGTIYVADPRQKAIQVFDRNGRFVHSIGRAGEGPGEFKFPGQLEMTEHYLLVYDWRLRRLSWFDPSGAFLKNLTIEEAGFPQEVRYWDGSHFLMLARALKAGKQNDRYYEIAFLDSLGKRADSLGVFYAGPRRILRLEGGMVISYATRYDTDLLWAVVPGQRIYVGYSGEYVISVYDGTGRLIRRITREWQPVPISQEKREEMLSRFRQIPKPMRSKIQIPKTEPAFYALLCDDLGFLWVKRTSAPPYRFDLFDSEGRFVCRITLDVNPMYWKNGLIYGKRVDSNRGTVELVRLRRLTSRQSF